MDRVVAARKARYLADPEAFRRLNASDKHRWSDYRTGAKKRGLEWALTYEQFCAIRARPCIFHGAPTPGGGGLDRLDNDIGYTLKNSVPCCKMCNQMKHAFPWKLFVTRCKEIADRFFPALPGKPPEEPSPPGAPLGQ